VQSPITRTAAATDLKRTLALKLDVIYFLPYGKCELTSGKNISLGTTGGKGFVIGVRDPVVS
jgi:hypothetical protein